MTNAARPEWILVPGGWGLVKHGPGTDLGGTRGRGNRSPHATGYPFRSEAVRIISSVDRNTVAETE